MQGAGRHFEEDHKVIERRAMLMSRKWEYTIRQHVQYLDMYLWSRRICERQALCG